MYLPENKEELPYSLELFCDFVGVTKVKKPQTVPVVVPPVRGWTPQYQGQEPPF